MSSVVNLKASGLNTSPNTLTTPEGALSVASNVIIKRDNVVESRRGFGIYGESFGSSSDRAKQLIVYKQRILRHYSTVLQYESGTDFNGVPTFDAFNGSYSEPDSGIRIKSIESNGNLYFTTSAGIKKISAESASDFTTASGYVTDAGGVKALNGEGTLNLQLGNQSGFLPQDSAVAYRIVWGIKDANNNLIQGTPSERITVYNSLQNLLILDINNLLVKLDDITDTTSASFIDNGNYSSTLALPSSASVSELKANVLALAAKLDADIVYGRKTAGSPASPLVISNLTLTAGGLATVDFSSGTPSSYMSPGDYITIKGLTTTAPGDLTQFNGNWVVGTSGATSITFTITGTVSAFAATAADAAAELTTNKYGKAVENINYNNVIYNLNNLVITVPPTNQQLVIIQAGLESIIVNLQNEPTTTISSANQTNFITPIEITTSANVNLSFIIPDAITSDYFYQIYRSSIFEATGTTNINDVVPNDELQLVIEDYPTSAQLSASLVEVTDSTPDAFRGANLYTNNTTGEGILQANDVPPFAKDINLFKNRIFFANTKTKQRKIINLLGVQNLLADYALGTTPTLTIATATSSNTYSFVAGAQEIRVVTTDTVANTASSGWFSLYTANDAKSYYVWMDKTGTDTDPAPNGYDEGIRVYLVGLTTAAQGANKINETLSTYVLDFTSEVLTGPDRVQIANVKQGPATDTTKTGLINAWAVSTTQSGVGENAATLQVLLSSNPSPSQAVEETAKSLVNVINQNSAEVLNAYYISGTSDLPGKILLEARNLSTGTFYTITNNSNTGASFNPVISPDVVISSAGAITVANPTVLTSPSHGLANLTQIVITGSNSTPSIDGLYTVTVTGANTFTIPVNVTATAGTSKFSYSTVANTEHSDNEVKGNRVYFSKYNEPESVPIVNYMDVGASDKAILRIFPLRDSLFVFKEDGLYRISGEITPFTVSLFDSSCIIIAADSVAVSNNLVYVWTTQGVSSVSESGVNAAISRPIDVDILKLASSQYTYFPTATWGVGYESDNSYIVWTVSKTTDQVATQAFRYSTITNTWTTFSEGKTCGIVNHVDDKLYLGAGDTNYIEQERKTFSRYDYSDREISKTLDANKYFGTRILLSNVSDIAVGDVLVQTQTLTVYTFNQLLKKLDIDVGVPSTNYFSSIPAAGGDNMKTDLLTLTAKLDADSLQFTNYTTNISSKTGSVSSNSVAAATVITTGASHGLVSGRKVTLSGVTGSIPTINGDHVVTVLSANTFSIPVNVTTAGTGGTFATIENNFTDIEACYNSTIAKLNLDSIVAYSNYTGITGTTVQEAVITSVTPSTKEITVNIDLNFVQGALSVFKAIETIVVYQPTAFNDYLNFKQIYESTMMFENKAFTNATLSFSSDLLPEFIEVPFNGDGNGIFGHQNFGTNFFGGGSHPAPFRTLIPRQAQRCRYLNIKFRHRVAREMYSIFGISLTGNIYSTRAYR